jgi:hypothetical protein
MFVELRNEDGSYHRWDPVLYTNIYRDRNVGHRDTHIEDHPLIGKRFLKRESRLPTAHEKNVTIESVHLHWFCGYYQMAIYVDDNNSHGTVIVKNINSISPVIIDEQRRWDTCFEEIK